MVVVDPSSSTTNSDAVSVSDTAGTSFTLKTGVLPLTTGYITLFRATDFWITQSLSAAPPTIFQLSSDDGTSFSPSNTIATRRWYQVAQNSAGLLVAAEAGNTALSGTSTDGITWTSASVTLDGPSAITRLVYAPALDRFVFLSSYAINAALDTRAFSTVNGLDWNIHLAFGKFAGTVDLCWSPGQAKFVAVSTGNTPTSTYPRGSWTSTDGQTWTEHVNALPDLFDSRAVCWSEELGLYVCCAYGYNDLITNKILTSPDGEVWTERTLPISGRWVGIAWNGVVFCVVDGGFNVSFSACTSPDGITWTERSLGAIHEWGAIAAAL